MNTTLDDLETNMKHCWRCSHCKWTPSLKDQRFNKICPSMEWGNFHAYSGGGKVITAYALRKGDVTCTDTMLESVFACTMCGACDTGCKSNNGELIEPLDILYALRAKIATDGHSLPVHVEMMNSLRAEGNPYGKPATDRMRWADGLGLKDASREPVDVLLHIGCENAYSADYRAELLAIVGLLRRAGVDFGIHPGERATGELAYDLGFQADALDEAQAMALLLRSTNARTAVTCSAGSYAAIRNIWPRLGVPLAGVAVRHITDFVEDLFVAGKLEASGTLPATAQARVTYHDSCKLGRLSEAYTDTKSEWTTVLNNWRMHEPPKQVLFGPGGLYDAPRKLLARIAGVSVAEMPRHREAGWCCGGAGGAPEAYPEFAAFAAEARLEEARSTGATVVVTASCACQRQLAGAAQGSAASPLEVTGLFALLAQVVLPVATVAA